jgi:cellulose biosynthesis protein BcsQ
MMLSRHMDEARKNAIESLCDLIKKERDIERAVLIDDLFGSLRVVVWTKKGAASDPIQKLINEQIAQVSSPFWTGEIFFASEGTDVDRLFYDSAWEEGRPANQEDILRVADRYRSRGSWLNAYGNPPWKIFDDTEVGPPIVVFYSFKGGVGRSTALAAFAIQCARASERVCVVDFDLDAPGIGVLLSADEQGTASPWGVLDYLLERPRGEVELHDYYHICRRETVTRSGEIYVFPAGKANSGYLGKLARIDFELPVDSDEPHPLVLLLRQIQEELSPDWILIDARAGLSEPAGLLLGGIAHMYVIFGTSSEQSWQGLRLVLGRLGAERVLKDEPQLDCQLVQAMVPEDLKAAKATKADFADRAKDEFASNYYAEDPVDPDEDRKWYVRDLDDDYAPHVPAAISYQPWLAHFDIIDEIADKLIESKEHKILNERIIMRFSKDEEEDNDSNQRF